MSKTLSITYESPESLKPNLWNPNRVAPENLDKIEKSLGELESFKPVVVRELEDGELEIVDGEHRTEVYKRRGELAPVINLGKISDEHAKKITLAANAQYGENDTVALHDMLSTLGSMSDLATILPESSESLEEIANLSTSSADIDWDDLDLDGDSGAPVGDDELPGSTPGVNYQLLKAKMEPDEAEEVNAVLEAIIKKLGADDSDPAVNRGDALVFLAKEYLKGEK